MGIYRAVATYTRYVEVSIEADGYDSALKKAEDGLCDGLFEDGIVVKDSPFVLLQMDCPDGKTIYIR